jgi:hypothetical protein
MVVLVIHSPSWIPVRANGGEAPGVQSGYSLLRLILGVPDPAQLFSDQPTRDQREADETPRLRYILSTRRPLGSAYSHSEASIHPGVGDISGTPNAPVTRDATER